jgi:predicted DNA-binding transcriptional regulator AlpA
MAESADRTAVAETAGTPRGTFSLGEPLVDAAAVAAWMSCDKTTVYRLAASCALPSVEIAPRVLRFRPADVRAFVEGRTRQSPPRPRVKQLLGPGPAYPGAAGRN